MPRVDRPMYRYQDAVLALPVPPKEHRCVSTIRDARLLGVRLVIPAPKRFAIRMED